VILAHVGGCAGLLTAASYPLPGRPPPHVIREYPLPHHIPKYEGGISLRFAMVHDVIHERYPRHGEAYYRERNRLARQGLASGRLHDEAFFALFDDLGAGLDALKDDDEAVRVLRDKLREQEARGWEGRRLYTTYANLGTFLIHGSARAAFSGDAAAKERLREGLSFIRKSIEVNPEAHFGREVWQAVAVEYLLAASAAPGLLRHYDMIGDRLDEEIDPRALRSYDDSYGGTRSARDVAAHLNDDEMNPTRREWCREHITRVGVDKGWVKALGSSLHDPVPFDEPVLGIIGMWRLGGGASPHFALALGEIMLRVGQRYIAWCAYERAAGLADRVGADPDVRREFAEHCRRRQQLIERQLPDDEAAALRPRFEAELAFGQRYQKEYQQYEADRIAAGASLDDPHFYDDFEAAHPPIASPVGAEEKFVAEVHEGMPHLDLPFAVFCAGVGACLAAFGVRFVERRRRTAG
jgi:hypothetical protein